jgi:hypothetical protein
MRIVGAPGEGRRAHWVRIAGALGWLLIAGGGLWILGTWVENRAARLFVEEIEGYTRYVAGSPADPG